jgi:hypothetical protein
MSAAASARRRQKSLRGGSHQVKGVAHGDRRLQRRPLPLLPQVAGEDVGAQRPPRRVQVARRGPGRRHVAHHAPHVPREGGAVELGRGHRRPAGPAAVEHHGADAGGPRARHCVLHIAVLGAAGEAGEQDEDGRVRGKALTLRQRLGVQGDHPAVRHAHHLAVVQDVGLAAEERGKDGLHVAVVEEGGQRVGGGEGGAKRDDGLVEGRGLGVHRGGERLAVHGRRRGARGRRDSGADGEGGGGGAEPADLHGSRVLPSAGRRGRGHTIGWADECRGGCSARGAKLHPSCTTHRATRVSRETVQFLKNSAVKIMSSGLAWSLDIAGAQHSGR